MGRPARLSRIRAPAGCISPEPEYVDLSSPKRLGSASSEDDPGDIFPGGAFPDATTNHALLVSYEGTAFCGWQIQPNGESVQGRLERALSTILRRPGRVTGSGRTDSGVHALGQVAHVFLPAGVDTTRLRNNLNGLAGPEISVKALVPVPPNFHARHRAKGKHYQYRIFNHPYPPVFERKSCLWLKRPLDVPAMAQAAALLLGRHDFSAFRAIKCEAKHPLRELRRLEVREVEGLQGEGSESQLRIDLEADAFLQHMARIIVGTLVAVGKGRLKPDDLSGILASRKRENAAATAPAAGLHLMRVYYDLNEFPQLRAFQEA